MGGPYCQWRRPYVRVELNSEQADTGGMKIPGEDMGWVEAGVSGKARCPFERQHGRDFRWAWLLDLAPSR